MKEYVYEIITHPIDLYQQMEQLNQSVNYIENKIQDTNFGVRELLDLGNDNWAIYSSVRYFENIKQTMQTNYTRNWMRLMYARNKEDDMVFEAEVLVNYDKMANRKKIGFETYKSETWIQRNGDVRMVFVFLNEHFLKQELWYIDSNKITNTTLYPRVNEVQDKIAEMGKNIEVYKFDDTENRFDDLEKSRKIEIVLKLIINSLRIIFPNKDEHISEKVRLEIMGVRQAEQKLMEDFSTDVIILDELAKIAGVNRVKFQELFKKLYGDSFYVHYQQGRFNHAKKLIIEENYNLCEAAYAVGFKNLSHFSRQFERLMGVKPKHLKCKTFSVF